MTSGGSELLKQRSSQRPACRAADFSLWDSPHSIALLLKVRCRASRLQRAATCVPSIIDGGTTDALAFSGPLLNCTELPDHRMSGCLNGEHPASGCGARCDSKPGVWSSLFGRNRHVWIDILSSGGCSLVVWPRLKGKMPDL